MHVHVSLITLKDPSTIGQCAELMGSMEGRIAGMVKLEVRRNELPQAHSCSIAIITTWVDTPAYEQYRVDPIHREVAAQVTQLMSSAATLDYLT